MPQPRLISARLVVARLGFAFALGVGVAGCHVEAPEPLGGVEADEVTAALQGRWEADAEEGRYTLVFDADTLTLAIDDAPQGQITFEILERGDDWARLLLHHETHDAATVVAWRTEDEMTIGWMDDWVFTRSR